jgi:hypothetical protein
VSQVSCSEYKWVLLMQALCAILTPVCAGTCRRFLHRLWFSVVRWKIPYAEVPVSGQCCSWSVHVLVLRCKCSTLHMSVHTPTAPGCWQGGDNANYSKEVHETENLTKCFIIASAPHLPTGLSHPPTGLPFPQQSPRVISGVFLARSLLQGLQPLPYSLLEAS